MSRDSIIRSNSFERGFNVAFAALFAALIPFGLIAFPTVLQKLLWTVINLAIFAHSVRVVQSGASVINDHLVIKGPWRTQHIPLSTIEEVGIRNWSIARSIAFVRTNSGAIHDIPSVGGVRWQRKDNPKVVRAVHELRDSIETASRRG